MSSAPPGSILDLTVNVNVLIMDATISWSTPVNSSGNLLYLAEGSEPYGMPMTAYGNDSINHSVRVNGLRQNTWYRCTVQSVLGGNYLAAQEERFYTNVSVMDVVVTPSKTTAEISWSTDTVCACTLDYWEYGSNVTSSGEVTSGNGLEHHASLSDLIPGVSYGYRIVARCNADPSRSAFNVSSFTTKPSYVKNVTVVVNGTGADVSWTVPAGMDCTFDRSGPDGMLMPENVVTNGTSRSVHLSGLEPLTTCSFVITAGHGSELLESCDSSFVASRVNGNGTVEGYGILHLNGGGGQNDAGQGIDAGDGFGAAMFLVPGSYNGRVISTTDTLDYYQTNLTFGQTVDLSLTPLAGSDLSLYLLNGNGIVVASSANSRNGVAEHIHYSNTGIPGMYRIEVLYVSGASPADYSLYYGLIGTTDSLVSRFSDSGDNEAIATHIEGFSVEPSSGWVGKRAPAHATFYMNLYDHTYQVHTGYVVSVRYLASTDVQLTMYDGASWVTVATLPGKSTWWTYSFKLSGSYYDVLSARAGMNVWFQLSAPISVSAISAQAYDYQADFYTSGSEHRSGIYLESGWSTSGGVANGSANATIICSLPSSSTSFIVSFTDSSLIDGLVVKEADWVLGSLYRNGNDAVIELDRRSYRDVDPTTPNMDVRLTLLSALVNLTSLELLPATYYSDVGSANDMSSQYHAPGVWLDGNSMWGTPGSENVLGETRTYRTGGTNAYFYLTGAVNGLGYDVGILYKASSNVGYVEYCYGPSNFEAVATLATDGQWHTVHFQVATSLYYDARTDDQLDLWFWITAAGTEVSRIYASPDSDADGFTDANEAIRFQASSPGFSGLSMHTFDVYAYAPATFAVSFTVSYGYVYLDGVPLIGTWDVPLSPLFNLNLDPGNHQIGVSTQPFGYAINILVRNTLTTNPYAADTDSDNLNDLQEFNAGTDPRNPDTDHDGLLDGNERFSYVVSTDQFVRLPASVSTPATLAVHLPGFNGTIDDVYVQVGVVGVSSSNLAVHVTRDGWPNVVNVAVPTGCSSLFASWNLYPTGAWARSAFNDAANWYVTIYDNSSVAGTVQYVKIQVDGRTNPLNPDSDWDGINDSEEVNMGVDGYVTCPVLADSDNDGLTDYNEDHGITPCGHALDPTLADTDGDGSSDNADHYYGDMMLHLHFSFFNAWESINNGDVHDIFFTVLYNSITLSTDRLHGVRTNVDQNFGMDYYIEADDAGTSTSFVVDAVADNAGSGGDDIKLDIESTSCDACDFPFTFSYGNGHTNYDAIPENDGTPGDWNTECEVRFYMETVIKPKCNVILINSTGEDGDGGIYVAADGTYRYCADEQVYLIYLTCSGTSAHFQSGINTIIVPRYLALESQLNDTLTTDPSTSEIAGASFYTTDTTLATSSGHIVAVISKDTVMTPDQAESFLSKLTHKTGNVKIADSVSVDSNNVYLLHLPKDVQSRIPYVSLDSSPLGEAPNYLSIGAVLQFAYDCLVSIGTALYHLATSLLQAGISYLCDLWGAVTTVVNKLADAFNAFLAWAVQFVSDTINAIFGPIVQAINKAWTNYWQGVNLALNSMKSDYVSTGSISSQSLSRLSNALGGEFLSIILGVTAVISILLITLTIVTNVFSFMLSMAISLAVGYIFEDGFNTPANPTDASTSMSYGTDYGSVTSGMVEDTIEASESQHPPQGSQAAHDRGIALNVISAAIGVFGSTIGVASLNKNGYTYGIIGIIAGLTASALGCVSAIAGNDLLGYLAIGIGLVSSIAGYLSLSGGSTFTIGAGIFSLGMGGLSIGLSLIPVIYH